MSCQISTNVSNFGRMTANLIKLIKYVNLLTLLAFCLLNCYMFIYRVLISRIAYTIWIGIRLTPIAKKISYLLWNVQWFPLNLIVRSSLHWILTRLRQSVSINCKNMTLSILNNVMHVFAIFFHSCWNHHIRLTMC